MTVSVNATDITGQTALQGAVTVGYRDIVQLLIKHGANVNQCQSSVENRLGESDNVDAVSGVYLAANRRSPLEIACSQGDLEMAKLLLSSGAEDIDHKSLNSAIMADNTEVITLLLQQGIVYGQRAKKIHFFGLIVIDMSTGKGGGGGGLLRNPSDGDDRRIFWV